MTREWYEDGLQFSCQQCGNCCSGQPGYVWVTPQEIQTIQHHLEEHNIQHNSNYLRRIGQQFSLVEKNNGDCIFLRRNEKNLAICAINQVKPKQCKSWPFWDSLLQSKQSWDEEAKTCPGMNRGKHYSYTEIETFRQQDKDQG
ncbi:YkgJ family cysteine cluster protein [Candidatus Uabimicrobium amorphum]|uniref:Zinc/iron-chelating domain-containing protein n=1 Tax=Uabimicrobium amorphum TaxID=2596890 RepID=A0A5S9F4E1_UABAM|nr:YkgJ family cysteine cluster protein [Candidatus Uabimicrobium amorphum]BBM85686.1 zinc/iron-chelating domain-containing protein [Candidatus Uabimicrobium amorphum]